MTLRRRLERLEAKLASPMDARPPAIFMCADGGEADLALLMGGGTLAREPGETEADFIARACQEAGDVD